jgi:tripeptide aminopeptidase
LANLLADELRQIGVADVIVTEHAQVIAKLPPTADLEDRPSVVFMAHLDTSEECPADHVNPQIFKDYDGSVLEIGNGVVLDPAVSPILKELCIGDTLITTDGTTLLGGDDKAGIAILVTFVDFLIRHSLPHGPIEILFNPDEEILRHPQYFPKDIIQSKIGYTIDGLEEGEIENENFNAWSVKVEFIGKSAHPGYARGEMVNAILMASTLINLLPRSESPEATDGVYGYYSVMAIEGHIEKATAHIIIRDFVEENGLRKLENIRSAAELVEGLFQGGKVIVEDSMTYRNMKVKIDEAPIGFDLLKKAMELRGIVPNVKRIRGGTDGAVVSQMGIPTPNMFSGAYNVHSRKEFVVHSMMVAAVDVLLELVKLFNEVKPE